MSGPCSISRQSRRYDPRVSWATSTARLSALESLREYTERQEYEKVLPVLRDALGADQVAKRIAEGSTWTEDQAVAEAMLI